MPSAFVSYSWDSDEHKRWVEDLGTRLQVDGVDLDLDQWKVHPGDQLPAFMETAVRENDFVLIICTPRYKTKSDAREGGVGYEGNILTAELLTHGNERKFIPLLREGGWPKAAPSWLLGKKYIDFRGDPYSEDAYDEFYSTLFGFTKRAPRTGRASSAALAPEALTRQSTYSEFANSARKVLEAANKRRAIWETGGGYVASLLLEQARQELEAASSETHRLLQEIFVWSSEDVKKAAGGVIAVVMEAQIKSMSPKVKADFKDITSRFSKALLALKDEIRSESNLR